MAVFHSYVSSQCRPQATGHETPLFFWVWGGGDLNVPVNLLISCMLRELRGLGGVGGDVNVPVNLLTSCLLMSCMLRELRGCLGYKYIYIYTILHNENHI